MLRSFLNSAWKPNCVKFAAIVEKENGKENTTEAAITYEDKKKNLTSINTESDNF